MNDHPKVENAPGLTWRKHSKGWEARWRPRTDLVDRGYSASPQRLWGPQWDEPSDVERQWISDRCNFMQSEMLVWAKGGIAEVAIFDGTLGSLIKCYETDPDSSVHKLRWTPRLHSARMCKVISTANGDLMLTSIKARQILRWHEEWTERGIAMAHGLIGKLRTVIRFGAVFLEDKECERLSVILHGMRFKMPQARTERLTADQAVAVRRMSHACGLHSVALAQALQFELMLRQKDVIGEWVPQSEPGLSTVARGVTKWLRGMRWEEIDSNLILCHNTSKKEKDLTVDLKMAPMVVDELTDLAWSRLRFDARHDEAAARAIPRPILTRDMLPTSGPVIVSEYTAYPYQAAQFRLAWRKMANLAGIPKEVKNMDSRAGGISEATDAGAPIEHVRHAATHSDTAMTQKYSRGNTEKIAEVQKKRIEHRNRK